MVSPPGAGSASTVRTRSTITLPVRTRRGPRSATAVAGGDGRERRRGQGPAGPAEREVGRRGHDEGDDPADRAEPAPQQHVADNDGQGPAREGPPIDAAAVPVRAVRG